MSTRLLVGAGRGDITPDVGAILSGYAPGRPSETIHDHLHVTAYAFEYNGLRSLLVTTDLLLISDPLSTEMRRAMAEASGIPFEYIILTSTHTHSGPVTRRLPGEYPLDEDYLYNRLVPAAASAAKQAAQSLRPALMGVGVTESDVGINRREIAPDGSIRLGQNPFGSRDPVMTVVSFREPDGAPIANIIHYGAHNTASGPNPEITRDWCGVMIDRLEETAGGITAFFNGCEGDCGPNLPNGQTTGDLQLALELGGRAAIDAVRAWRSITEWQSDCDMRVVTGDVKLPLKPLPSIAELERQIAEMGDPAELSGLKSTEYGILLERAGLARSGKKLSDFRALPHTVISVGPVAFLPVPFEVFSVITLRLRRYSPYPHTLSLSNGNGSIKYFPSQDQLCRGGYEVWLFTSMEPQPFADDSEQYYVSGCTALLEKLKNQDI